MPHAWNVRRSTHRSKTFEGLFMSELEPEEKVAGRLFRDSAQLDLDQLNAATPARYPVPSFLAVYRHICPGRQELSTALELREVWVPSPRIVVETPLGGTPRAVLYELWRPTDDVDLWHMPAGRFGFIYREGKCRSCQRTARSEKGRFVDGWERPPILGARG